jgi:hypothetical protein
VGPPQVRFFPSEHARQQASRLAAGRIVFRIALAVALNGAPMGSVVPASRERRIEVAVVVVGGGAALDAVDLLHNN